VELNDLIGQFAGS